ncbi:HupE/UreJ family protein [Leptolyngbya cf. ectocarpi LEGE 11479]|uniref:HupE/UreJ family protein n=1 Tax=Leptolyngbya cf. ectocarpi LEGE 11479 TaxID=1828722 RepID=A0A928ZUD1_LEPEC|nr:HupE/UreJ family protein [Leptolyngbya ectocarpi]MBE9067609.1 HupE/UreJ family protein [Leptolyngbya cf. ectocarpi LEGE 11479]
MRHFVRFLQVGFFGLLASLWIGNVAIAPAAAHWADLAVADIIVSDAEAQITLTVPTALLADADDNGDNILSQAEFDQHYSQLEQQLGRSIVLTNQTDAPGSFTVALAAQLKQTHSTFLLQYQWPVPLQQLSIRYSLFSSGLDQCLATITQGNRTRNIVFTPENNTVKIAGSLPWQQQFLSFLKLGVEHIFTGYDHILFLVALLLPGGNLPQLLKIVTAFTIAHSLTLTLAALNIVTLPTALVESVIALSIVYVAAENLWRKQIGHRPWLTFGFGLIHGLGFANILRELTQSQGNLLLSLASFNLGVELGQIGIVLLVFYGLRFLQKRRGELALRYGISALMILMGSVWFAERALAAWL